MESTAALTVVAAHGNGGGAFRFEAVPPHLPPDVGLHAVTLPGFGGRPADPTLRSVPDFADALAVEVEAVSRPRILLGHGIGGSFALDLASRRPETIDGLILHAPVAADLDRRLLPRLMATPPVREVMRRLIASRALRPVLRRLFFRQGAPRERLDRFFDEYRNCEAFGLMWEIIDADWFGSLEPAAVPAVVLWGGGDRLLGTGQADAVADRVPGARIVVEPDWGHFPMLERPEEYADVVADLARSLAPPSSA